MNEIKLSPEQAQAVLEHFYYKTTLGEICHDQNLFDAMLVLKQVVRNGSIRWGVVVADKVRAIKTVRALTNNGLKEAKDMCDGATAPVVDGYVLIDPATCIYGTDLTVAMNAIQQHALDKGYSADFARVMLKTV